MPNVLSNKNTLANRNALNREKLAREMTHNFSASGVPNDGQRLRDLVNDARGFVADMSPGYGDVLASQRASQAYGQAWDALKGGDIGQAMGRGAEGLAENLSIIPGIGEIATMGKAATGLLPGLLAMTRGANMSGIKKYYHVVDKYDGGDLESLYHRYGDAAYDMYLERWPESGNLSQYHAHNIHLYDSLEEAQKHSAYFGGDVLEIIPDDALEVTIDTLEFPHPIVEDKIPKKYITPIIKAKTKK